MVLGVARYRGQTIIVEVHPSMNLDSEGAILATLPGPARSRAAVNAERKLAQFISVLRASEPLR